jgi:hypothetical protein
MTKTHWPGLSLGRIHSRPRVPSSALVNLHFDSKNQKISIFLRFFRTSPDEKYQRMSYL